jgi:hypothetical protein
LRCVKEADAVRRLDACRRSYLLAREQLLTVGCSCWGWKHAQAVKYVVMLSSRCMALAPKQLEAKLLLGRC